MFDKVPLFDKREELERDAEQAYPVSAVEVRLGIIPPNFFSVVATRIKDRPICSKCLKVFR